MAEEASVQDVDIAEQLDTIATAKTTAVIGVSEFVLYLVIVLSAIPLGYFSLQLRDARSKMLLHCFGGASLIAVAGGLNAAHPFLLASVCYLLMQLPKRFQPHGIIFAVVFSYALFYRICHFYFPELPKKGNAIGGIMFVLQLRIVSVAFDVLGNPIKIGRGKDARTEEVPSFPSALMYFAYVFSFMGVGTGPVVTFKDFYAYIGVNPTKFNKTAVTTIKTRQLFALKWIVLYIIGKIVLPKPDLVNIAIGWQGVGSMVYSAAWMGAALLNLRLMYYSAWILGEQSFLLGGFGTTASNGFELEQVQAIEPFEVEINSWYDSDNKKYAYANIIRYWNMSIQRWLVRYIFKRFPVKALRPLVTMMTSAYLHGINIGFYLFFLHALVLDFLQKKWMNTDWTLPLKHICVVRWTYMFVYYNVVFRSFEYCCIPYHMPGENFSNILKAWENLGYFGHGVLSVMAVVVAVMPQKLENTPLKTIHSQVNIAKGVAGADISASRPLSPIDAPVVSEEEKKTK